MPKLSLTDITAGHLSSTTVSANNTLIEDAIENTLSRDGTTPNTMSADLDMNSQRITNLPTAVNNSEPVTLGQSNILAGVTNPLTQDSVGAVLLPQTTAETNASITPASLYVELGNTRRYTNGLVDALLVAVQAAATVERNILLADDLTIANGAEITVPTTGTAITTHGMSVRAAPGVYILYTGTATAVTIGSAAAVSRNVYWNVPILNSAQNWDDGTDTASIGLKLIGVDRSEIHVDIEGFNVGLNLNGTTLGNVHNKFYVRELLDNRIHILLDRTTGFNNSNRFWGGRLGYRSSTMDNATTNAIVTKHIDQAHQSDNANEFYLDCEAVLTADAPAASCVMEFNGEYNFFRGRMEVTNTKYTQTILFPNSGNSEFNEVIITRGLNDIAEIILGVSNPSTIGHTNSVKYGHEELTRERKGTFILNENTTDASALTIELNGFNHTIPPEYAGTWVQLKLVVFNDDSTKGHMRFRHAFVQRIGTGNLAINAQADTVDIDDGFTGSVVFATNGTRLQLVLTGQAAVNYRWTGTIEWQHAIGNL